MITAASTGDADLLRLRHQYLAVPTLSLTLAQVARLLAIRVEHASAILAMMEEEGWLIRSEAGQYRLPPSAIELMAGRLRQ